jgi:signal peptidase II
MLKKMSSSGLVWLWLTIILVAFDQVTKFWVTHHLHFFEPFRILPFLNLTLAYNTGAAFSFLHSASGWQNWIFSTLAIIVSFVVLFWLGKLPGRNRWLSIALCLILAGALGNAWDRMTYGYVIDFLDFHAVDWHFAIFNIADGAICVGAAMLFWDWIR